ncbi:MAG: homoserine O-succinyltransferase [Solobacterium sp.]|jgi:homoserine O-succinyltransferase|nr:homoserine O-succinyltransferase [Solobacterium sp.]MCH4049837.1 homoserine O-succinyltransferase [Solobacterium sp.]MCH4073522.1 homoserine O-succinyltransferase [Solobacterium sp.]MCI1314300.1 homoserine O-succinyltransferase [Solobacterium sp.]MCI1346467.1 homoserine O-succinyltransferase [Solobacterium sp.]
MPIKIANDLPAARTLEKENIFYMSETRALTQNIRPLHVLLLNLMPTKIETETQFARVLGNTPIQIELDLIAPATHISSHISEEHMLSFYRTFADVKQDYFDGMIITGAPVEQMAFEEVDYWDELCEIMAWSKTHVHSTLHLCWGAQAGLYFHYGIPKRPLDHKVFGVFPHHTERDNFILFRGFDDIFYIPHSRHTETAREDVEAVPELTIMASSKEAGIYAIKTENGRQIYLMGHAEYDRDTLKHEYERDVKAGKPIDLPKHYFPDDDPARPPINNWRSSGHMIYANWVNYILYQTTPYDITAIGR